MEQQIVYAICCSYRV